jgi:hypothetical protein
MQEKAWTDHIASKARDMQKNINVKFDYMKLKHIVGQFSCLF